MHPAASVILFTTSTGFGYGLLIWIAIAFSLTPENSVSLLSTTLLSAILIALCLITIGLLSSLWHLGHPERAWRAISQWRSSWLSREGVFAIFVYAPATALLFSIYFLYPYWISLTLLIITAILSAITVYCTAMIYASLKPIPAWYNNWTITAYLLNAIASGGVLWQLISSIGISTEQPAYQSFAIISAIALAFGNKILYWRHVSKQPATTTHQSATGFKGKIKPLDPPHSSANYLMKEMGFQLVREKAKILKPNALLFAFLLPAALLFFNHISLHSIALLSCALGMAIERYLFFAEAKHVVTLYYR